MISFRDWRKKQQENFRVSPSIIDDEGDGIERVLRDQPTAPLDAINPKELPPTAKNGGTKNKGKIKTTFQFSRKV